MDKQKQITWLTSLQNPDGGFCHFPGNPSNITHTYFATKALMELGALDQIDKKKTVEFIVSAQHSDGGFGQSQNQQPHVEYTYYAIPLLKELTGNFIQIFENLSKEIPEEEDFNSLDVYLGKIYGFLQYSTDKEVSEVAQKIKLMQKETRPYEDSLVPLDFRREMPNFVYFESIDILGDKISLQNYLQNKEEHKTFSNLFKLSNLNIEEINKIGDVHQRKRTFRNASVTLTGLVNESWKQEDVEVHIDIDGDWILIFIEDQEGAKADPPSRRSDGFRWYLSFYTNFTAGTKGELRNAILLLDNPGWVLHPSGQKDLLNTLGKIAEENQIIIATHSPFLIDKNKLDRIRMVERKRDVGSRIYEKFWDSMFDCFQVIRASIGADLSDSLFGHKNNIIVEGYSDKIYLEAMCDYLKKKKKHIIDLDKVMIIGAGGADKIPYLLAWHKAEKYSTLAILDSDNEGNKVVSTLDRENIEVNVDKDILKLDEITDYTRGKSLEIEDLFNEKFYHRAVNEAYQNIFQNKLNKPEIEIEELQEKGLRTKKYSKFFKEKNLGRFDKIKIALQIKEILEEEELSEYEIFSSLYNFEELFEKISEKFENKGIEISSEIENQEE